MKPVLPHAYATSWRSESLSKSIAIGEKYFELAGISRVARIDSLAGLQCPIFAVYRPNSRVAVTVNSGKGANELESRASGIFEAIEVACAEYKPKSISDTQAGLSAKGLEYISAESLGGSPSSAPFEWVRATDYETKKDVLVPLAQISLLPCEVPFQPDTNGLASGLTYEEAVLHGLLEVIERHNYSLALVHRTGLSVELDQIDDIFVHETLTMLSNSGLALEVKDISEWSDVPTYYALVFSLNEQDSHLIGGGMGTHLDPCIAIRRAILEAIQSRVVSIAGAREDIADKPRLKGKEFEAKSKLFQFWYSKTEKKALVPTPITPIPFDAAIVEIVQRARARDPKLNRLVTFKYAAPDDIYVVRSILEGAESFGTNRARRGPEIKRILENIGL